MSTIKPLTLELSYGHPTFTFERVIIDECSRRIAEAMIVPPEYMQEHSLNLLLKKERACCITGLNDAKPEPEDIEIIDYI